MEMTKTRSATAALFAVALIGAAITAQVADDASVSLAVPDAEAPDTDGPDDTKGGEGNTWE